VTLSASLARAHSRPVGGEPGAPEATPGVRVSLSAVEVASTNPVLRRRRKRPLVYLTETAREQAAKLFPGKVLEELVVAEILAGNVRGPIRASVVFAGDGTWEAETRRTPGRLRPRPRPWLVLTVRGGKQWPM
jgi:hypothetical protein